MLGRWTVYHVIVELNISPPIKVFEGVMAEKRFDVNYSINLGKYWGYPPFWIIRHEKTISLYHFKQLLLLIYKAKWLKSLILEYHA